MNNSVCIATVAAVALSAAPALADNGPVVHTDQLVVVTPNAPVMISNGNGAVLPAPAGPGAIDPEMPAAASGAPQNVPWQNVSHINGQLVKVGERNDYVLKYRKTNIASNPIGWMMGIYGLSVSHAVHPNVAVRVDANLITVDDSRGYELGASLPIYFRRVYSGPFIEPGIIARGESNQYEPLGDCYDCSSYDSGYNMVGPEMLFGWHWTFDSGLNVAAAFGIARNMTSEMDYGTPIEPAGYFRVGYAF